MNKKLIHPMVRGLTRAQRAAFVGYLYDDPARSRHPKTLAALVDAGLLTAEQMSKHTPLGIFTWVDHYVPLQVHAAYHLMVDFDEAGNITSIRPDCLASQ